MTGMYNRREDGKDDLSRRSQSVCLAVLPFDHLSNTEGRDYFARGFVEDLITELSRFPTLEVMSSRTAEEVASQKAPEESARRLGIDYLLTGSFRHSSERLRINTRLINPDRDTVLWAERYDSPLDGVFDIQDDIASQVVAALSIQIEGSRLARARRKPATELAAYDCWLRGMEHLRRGTLKEDEEARGFFRQALEIEPQNARAFAGMSLSYFNEWSCQLWDRWEENESKAFEYATRAAELDEVDHIIQLVLGRIHLFRRDFDRAEMHVDRSFELNPNDADCLVQLASCRAFLGDPELAIELMEKALRLNPYHDSWYYAYGAMPHFILRDYEKALEMASRSAPDLMVDLPAFKAAACAWLGRADEAAGHLQTFREVFTEKISFGRRVGDDEMLKWVVDVNPYRDVEQSEHLAEGLRRAGLGAPAPRAAEAAKHVRGTFRSEHGVRHMSFEGRDAQLPEIKGFADIAMLLSRPGEEVHCTELYGIRSGSKGDDVLDDRAKAEVRERIESLEAEIDEADDRNDRARASTLREEHDQLVEYLEKAFGLGGRPRKLGSTNERARSAVTQRIRSAIGRITEAHPELGAHCSETIRTGTFCAYEPRERVEWDL